MAASIVIKVGDADVTVRELTVAEVSAWLNDAEAGRPVNVAHELAFDAFGLDDLAHMSDISADELAKHAPSEMAELVRECKALNPHFFRVRARLADFARLMLKEAAAMGSTETPASS
jgi:hypothetical protein